MEMLGWALSGPDGTSRLPKFSRIVVKVLRMERIVSREGNEMKRAR